MSAVVTCPDCGSMVSKRAKACPKCGAPNRPANNPKVVLALVLVITALALFGCVALVNAMDKPKRPCPSQPAATSLGDSFQQGFEQGFSGCG